MRLLPLLPLLLLAGCRERGATVTETAEGRLVLGEAEVIENVERSVAPGGRTLSFDGFNGTIELAATDAPEARLRFTKRARGEGDGDAAQTLEGVEIAEVGDAKLYRFTMRAADPSLTAVDVRGVVPRGTPVRIRLATGTIAIDGLDAPLDIGVNNGTVQATGAAGAVAVRARNGTIDVALGRLVAGASVVLETMNGSLTVGLPPGADARIDAATRVGSVIADGLAFARRTLTPEGAGARFGGTLGTGRTRVTLRTQNGSIVLRPALDPATPNLAGRADTLATAIPGARPPTPGAAARRDSAARLTPRPDTLAAPDTARGRANERGE